MNRYSKPWLAIDDQISLLASKGVDVGERDACAELLRAVRYYRLTGYLYPFRESEHVEDPSTGRTRVRVLDRYQEGTSIDQVRTIIDFDRDLRVLVFDGMERIEVSFRSQLGYHLGRRSTFAHLDPTSFIDSFTEPQTEPGSTQPGPSKHEVWIDRARELQDNSREAFVAHFRENYEDTMPIWALTEILELGLLSRLYGALIRPLADDIASVYGAPSKRVMASWIASLNYVRNLVAHHARFFNRKLVVAPSRPRSGQVPLLDHLSAATTSKGVFGAYNALAVMAYLLRYIEPACSWKSRCRQLLLRFPSSHAVSIADIGVPRDWDELDLWK